ncbi:MAG: OmpA family protein [Flavobacteriaceae bacterium]|jgi:chemotaxis protein MotB
MKHVHLIIVYFFILFFSNCVTTKVFNDLEARYAVVKREKNNFEKSKDSIQKIADQTRIDQRITLTQLARSRDSVAKNLQNLKILQHEFDLLKQNSESIIQNRIEENNQLLREIAIKKTELEQRTDRITQLEQSIEEQKKALTALKEKLKTALLNFDGKGLTVEQRNGKVYVSMENKLLFQSGSWNVEAKGKLALRELANVLAENPDINILIEGHTDNVPLTPIGAITNNWDLSTKRATAVVSILLENNRVLPQNITAAGRSEYLPIASNQEAEGRAANRRIEVILSPSIEEFTELLQSNN